MKKLLISILCGLTVISIYQRSVFSDESDKNNHIEKKFQPRVELSVGSRVGENEGEADGYLTSIILDFAHKISKHSEISIRTIPFFAYIQEKDLENVYGVGIGGAFKVFMRESFTKTPYIEIHEVICLHQNHFEDNDSNINFNSAISIGYQINNSWDISARFSHISNANLKDNNDSTNIISLSVGHRF